MDKDKAWEFAIGLAQIDGVKVPDDFLELIEREKRGELTIDDIRRILYERYAVKEEGNNNE